MKLKGYQEKVLETLTNYLSALAFAKKEFDEVSALKPHLAKHINFPREAWEKYWGGSSSPSGRLGGAYRAKENGLNEPMPDVYLKVPTGGGKTLLACHSIDLIQKMYLKKQTGLILWIVPSTQIYRQTILALKNREHPYRQTLDISSGGRTLIKEKTEMFSRLDVEENLVVLMLMLPSAWRENQETLKLFRDRGGFTDFFPREDDFEGHKKIKSLIPNLDCFTSENEVFGTQIKTSLGNTLKLLKPLVIVDEGHRAYGEKARKAVIDFNPSFILELSATPPPDSNELVKITGRELHNEEMIKLDIHLTNKTSLDWKDTMLASKAKRDELEKKAKEYEQNTGEYIRPICLIQVERTGKDQILKDEIHSEHVKKYLLTQCNVPENQIAIKSSEKDDIEGINLFAKDCEIRYIITKQALQEGWDCSFAYLLTILTNPQSATGITQLVGRILRQPSAVKTKVKDLDECYIYTYKPNAAVLVREIKNGLESEGLGDIAGRISQDDESGNTALKDKDLYYRKEFKKFEGKIYLPKFVIQEKESWRDIIFEADILNGIDWEKMNVGEIADKVLSDNESKELELTLGLSKEEKELLEQTGRLETKGKLEIDEAFLCRQLGDIIPNPWIAFELGHKAIQLLSKKYDKDIIAANFVFVIEELKKILEKERDKMAEQVFKKLLDKKKLCFFLIQEKGHHLLPSHIRVKSNKKLVNERTNEAIQKSLFDYVPDEDLNDTEKTVAIYLDEQEQLLWWYRNRARQDFHIQGWQKHKIYPDFIAAKKSKTQKDNYDKVYVLETKGVHLKENDDTRYKKNVFALCNELGAKKAWKELFDEFPDHDFEFQVVYSDEWQNRVNELFHGKI